MRWRQNVSKIGFVAGLVLLLILGFGIRAYHLDAQALWADEIHSTTFAALSVQDLIHEMRFVDPHPPLYYLSLKFWLRVVSDTDFTVRWPSVAGSLLAIPAGAVLARRIGGRTAGLIAALLLTLGPMLVLYAQEARMYGLLLAVSTITTLRFHLAMERGSWRTWLAYAISAIVALYSHYYSVPLIALHVFLAWRVFMFRSDRWRILTAFGLIGATFGIWIYAIRSLGYEGWMEVVPFGAAVARSLWAFAIGTSVYPEQRWILSLPLLVSAGLGIISLVSRRQMGNLYLIAGGAVFPLGLAYLLGALGGKAAFHERYVIAGAPLFLVLAGIGIAWLFELTRRAIGQARFSDGIMHRIGAALVSPIPLCLGGIMLLGGVYGDTVALQQHFGDPRFAKENLRDLSTYLSDRYRSGDGLIVSKERLHVYGRYRRETLPLLQIQLDWDETERARALTEFTGGRDQIWMTADTGESDRRVWTWLDQHHFPMESRWFGLAPLGSWFVAPDPPRTLQPIELIRGGAVARVRNGGLAMVARGPNGQQTITVIGQWQRLDELTDLKLSIRIIDRRGRIVASSDRPVGNDSDLIGTWPTSASRDLRLALRIPPGLPEGNYDIQLVPYDAKGSLSVRNVDTGAVSAAWQMGSVDVPFVPSSNGSLVESRNPMFWSPSPGLRLVGADLPMGDIATGGKASIVLYWKGESSADLGPGMLGETRVGIRGFEAEVGPESTLAANLTTVGPLLFRDARTIRIPRTVPPGPVEILVRAKSGASNLQVLGPLNVVAGVVLEVPTDPSQPLTAAFGSIRLNGFDVIGDIRAGSTVTIGIHQEATGVIDRNLSVFVHAIGEDGRIVAQHDGAPCAGVCPTSSWISGDRFIDRHPIAIPIDVKDNELRLVIGFYDPATGRREPRSDGLQSGTDSVETGKLTLVR